MHRIIACTAFIVVMMFPSVLTGAEVSVWLSGQSFNGGPTFVVKLGELEIGRGEIDPIPDVKDGRRFDFTVSDDLVGSEVLSISLTNDAYEAGVGDRNLTVVKAAIGDVDISLDDFEFLDVYGYSLPMRGVLPSNEHKAVAVAPAGGWLQNRSTATDTLGPRESSRSAAQPPHSTDESATAAAPYLQAPPACSPGTILVDGYSSGVVTLSQRARELLGHAATYSGCSVTIIGYSSTSGPEELNKQIAQQRADAVSMFLGGLEVSYASVVVLSSGETDEFGPTQSDNRIVTVEFD